MRRLCIALIRAYQRTSRLRPRMCKFEPTCSEYMAQAIAKHGVIRGIGLGCWRILRCNPWSMGGDDPVP
ncbi:MAG: membrane protein insertion efficiency factor YidD [Chthonomonadales bacterium]|nr:membrane protein insertion efficiency factor YidD [Chthonomonadales bacterium]